MGILERILGIQEKDEQRAAEELAAKERAQQEQIRVENEKKAAEAQRQEAARLAAIEQEKRKVEARKTFVKEQTDRILHRSGVLTELGQMEELLLDYVFPFHGIIKNLDRGEIVLVWSEKPHEIKEGEVTPDYGYSAIRATIDPDKDTLTIRGSRSFVKEFTIKYYNDSPETSDFREALANAFLDQETLDSPSRPES